MSNYNTDTLTELFLDYYNNFLTVERFAEFYNLTLVEARDIIKHGKIVHQSQFI
jgi:hypothetical protein